MMDRAGSFAVVAALVLVSALHIVSAPVYLNAIPALLLIGGFARMLIAKNSSATLSEEDLSVAEI